MSRTAIHPWKKFLTLDERAEVKEIDLQEKKLSFKIKELRKAKSLIRMRSSKRASRGNKINC
jgi:hypothetical protein|tara:strand:- start:643 stop:828 length:186 start_codon:yes stop_codon:yes gene_type:complete